MFLVLFDHFCRRRVLAALVPVATVVCGSCFCIYANLSCSSSSFFASAVAATIASTAVALATVVAIAADISHYSFRYWLLKGGNVFNDSCTKHAKQSKKMLYDFYCQ